MDVWMYGCMYVWFVMVWDGIVWYGMYVHMVWYYGMVCMVCMVSYGMDVYMYVCMYV